MANEETISDETSEIRRLVRLEVEYSQSRLQEKITRQRAALELVDECFKELRQRHTDPETVNDLRVAQECIDRGLAEKNDFEPLDYHTRGLLNVFQGSPRADADKVLDKLEDIMRGAKRWDLCGELEKRGSTRCGAYPVEGNYLIEARDHICEILQFLPSLAGGDGETDRWVQDAAVKLHAVIHHSLPTELKRCTVDEWLDRCQSDVDSTDNGAPSAQMAENSLEPVQHGAAQEGAAQ